MNPDHLAPLHDDHGGTQRVRARWVAPVSSPPLENAILTVTCGLIESIESSSIADADVTDLGDVVLLPGFVNAHTHLQLTCCRGRVPYDGQFTHWIRDLMAVHPRGTSPEAIRQSMRDGLRESIASGVTTVADIGDGHLAMEEWADGGPGVLGFLEVLGIGARSRGHGRGVEAATRVLRDNFEKEHKTGKRGLITAGLSPHAPYSTDACVYADAVSFSHSTGTPICTHLAETPAEEDFLREGTGPFRDMLEAMGIWDGSYVPPGCSPVEFAEGIGLLGCRPLLAHVNYVSATDLGTLARHDCSVALCPRTHAFFKHDPHPYAAMLARGINVCIGTDSLASNETLSLLDELRFLRARDPTLDPATLVEMGTLAGARALRLDGSRGSLELGKRADLVAVPLAHAGTREPIDDLLSGERPASAVFLAGRNIPTN